MIWATVAAASAGLGGALDAFFWPIFDAIDRSAASTAVKNSTVIVPWAGAFHLVFLGLLGGCVLLVDMRMLGTGIRATGPSQIMRSVRPYLLLAIAGMAVTGVALGLGEVMRLFASPPYWLKMASLAAALLFTFGVRNRVLTSGGRLDPAAAVFAALSLLLWGGVFVWISNPLARVAMLLLGLLMAAFVVLAGRGATRDDALTATPRAAFLVKGSAVLDLMIWLTVAASGRWIAFW